MKKWVKETERKKYEKDIKKEEPQIERQRERNMSEREV